MTAKRFTETVSTGIVTDNVTGKEYDCEMRISDDLLNLLNKLHEENEGLKKRVKELELLNDGLNYALQNIRKIDVEIDVGDKK